MTDLQSPENASSAPTAGDNASFEPPKVPRWAQVVVGMLLLPLALLCTAGSIFMFGLPNVQSDPLLQFFAVLFSLLSLWAISLSARLILGSKGKDLLGPMALRMVAIAAIGLVIGGLFTGTWVEHPFRSAGISICYILVAVRLWKIAADRLSKSESTK